MSLLKRIESAKPAHEGGPMATPPAPPPGMAPPLGAPPAIPVPPPPPMSPRMISQVPVRESFRDTKYRIQQRVIADLDPKLDLTNQVEVRRQIEEIFSIAVDEEGLALTRAERVRMLELISDEIIGLVLVGFRRLGGFAQSVRGLIFCGNTHTFARGK